MGRPTASADVFRAIADPTRRRIIELLEDHPRTAGELANCFDTCQSTVSEHLAVLRKASLVTYSESSGRRTYSLCAHPLHEVQRWVRRSLSLSSQSTAPAHTETQAIETDAAASTVIDVLADPRRIPEWAPAFADTVSGDAASGWSATKDGHSFTVRVVVNREAGSVDYLRQLAPGREGGAYLRIVPRPGGGAVITMTLPVLPNVDAAETATTLNRELTALVSLVGATVR